MSTRARNLFPLLLAGALGCGEQAFTQVVVNVDLSGVDADNVHLELRDAAGIFAERAFDVAPTDDALAVTLLPGPTTDPSLQLRAAAFLDTNIVGLSNAQTVAFANGKTVELDVVVAPGGALVFEGRVASAEDDAEEFLASGTVFLDSDDLEFGDDLDETQMVGLRFTNVAIPRDATILSASIQFKAQEGNASPTTVVFEGEASNDAAAFEAVDFNLTSRATVGATVDWTNMPPWNNGDAGADQVSPDLASIVRDIVQRSGWESGNALVILISGAGHREAYSFDNSGLAGAAALSITWY